MHIRISASETSRLGTHAQMHARRIQNDVVDKYQIRGLLARNIQSLMDRTPGLDTQPAVAAKAGISQSQISRILRSELDCGLGVLASIANAFGRQPWELLVSEEATRRSVLEKILGATPVPDAEVEKHLPLPEKVVSIRKRKQ